MVVWLPLLRHPWKRASNSPQVLLIQLGKVIVWAIVDKDYNEINAIKAVVPHEWATHQTLLIQHGKVIVYVTVDKDYNEINAIKAVVPQA